MMKNSEIRNLVDEAIRLDKSIKSEQKQLNGIKAKLQSEAEGQIDNKNIKYVEYFGSMGKCDIANKTSCDITNYDVLHELMGSIINDKLTREETVKLTISDNKLKKAIIAVYKGEYGKHDIDKILCDFGLKDKELKAVKKKLKGEYIADKQLLEAYDITGELEEELDAIREQLNYENIVKFIDLEVLDIEKFKRTLYIEESLSLGLNYEKD